MRRMLVRLCAFIGVGAVLAYVAAMAIMVWPLVDWMAAPGTTISTADGVHVLAWCARAKGDAASAYHFILTWIEPVFIVAFAALFAVLARGSLRPTVWLMILIWIGAEIYEYFQLIDHVWCLVQPVVGWILYPAPSFPSLRAAAWLKLVSFGAVLVLLLLSRNWGVGKPGRKG